MDITSNDKSDDKGQGDSSEELVNNLADAIGKTPEEKQLLRMFGKSLLEKYLRIWFGKSRF